MTTDLLVLPEFLIEEDFDMMIGVVDESQECHRPWFDAEVCLEILCGREGRGFDTIEFSKFLEVRDFSMGEGEKNVPAIFIVLKKQILCVHPGHCWTQPRRFFTGEDGGMIETLEEDVMPLEKLLDIEHGERVANIPSPYGRGKGEGWSVSPAIPQYLDSTSVLCHQGE